MKRPLAYLTAAWSGEPDVDMELATHYCRLAYEAGFSPICPLLYLPLFLNDSVPEEHKAGIDMRRDMLRRSHTLIGGHYEGGRRENPACPCDNLRLSLSEPFSDRQPLRPCRGKIKPVLSGVSYHTGNEGCY